MLENTKVTKPEPERIPYPPMMSEAPASINFYFVTKRGYNCQLTLRDTDEMRLIDRMSTIVAHLESVGCKPKPIGQQPENKQPAPKPGNGSAAAATPGAQAAPAAPAAQDPKPAPTALSKPAPAAAGPETGKRFSTSVVKMKIIPQEDNKVNVEFFVKGHKFADVYDRMSTEKLLAMLAPTGAWTDQHMRTVASYDVSYIVDWELSERTNTKGNPYKNVLAIRPS